MLDATKAIEIAKTRLIELLGSTDIPDLQAKEITLEEVELDDASKTWEVSLGYPIPEPLALRAMTSALAGAKGLPTRGPLKMYKTIKIDSENGNFISMKNLR